MTFDGDIEPEDLVPEYVSTRAKLLELSRGRTSSESNGEDDMATARLEAKLKAIETDVLFDKFIAEQKWKSEKIVLERQFAAVKREAEAATSVDACQQEHDTGSNDGNINDEAERIAAEILAENNSEDDGDDLGGLFDSLPQNEIDPNTGKTVTVLNSGDGSRLLLREFGKWSGMSPRRVLEEACRSRLVLGPFTVQSSALTTGGSDTSAKLYFTLVSEATFACQHSVDISWSRAQELPQPLTSSDIEVTADSTRFTFTMKGVATPDKKQSEAYISTVALFYVFSNTPKDEKVHLKLPSTWNDVWVDMAEERKNVLDSQDREVVRSLRTLVRKRQDKEMEDGVIAFRGRGGPKKAQNDNENGSPGRLDQSSANSKAMSKIWTDKSGTNKFKSMLVIQTPPEVVAGQNSSIGRNFAKSYQCGSSNRRS